MKTRIRIPRGLKEKFLQWEKERKIRTMIKGRDKKSKAGFWHGGPIYGYRSGGKGRLYVYEPEAKGVRRIHYLKSYRKMSILRIARQMRCEDFVTRRGNTYWWDHTIRKILKNPIYRGRILYKGKKYKSKVPKII